ncbi:MAG: phage head-tail connector protein [Roseitalea sp.]|nr:phage head-tail connector protein [Roseitalea sp.]MBO6953639.1 phage head-tail connector protein [Rhizobiaceae bacterium]MBO6593932.1 phage head-tail connector protein [Roseitalea sp.]MBO6601383.1 phage head-tail connector protein [Roseitalea sp.]MBO6612879.1 phage head-tail connector protein [Roseitalea sp.]
MVLMPIGTPAVPPVTLADAKAHLRVTHEGEDTLIAELVDAAARFVADDMGLALIDQTWRLSLSEAPAAPVSLPRHPVAAIVAVTVYDPDGDPNVLEGSAYRLDTMRRPATLTFEPGSLSASITGVEIDFRAGFGPAGPDVPDTLRRAILTLVAHWYEFRGSYGPSEQPVSVPMAYSRLVRAWRRIGI